MDRIIAVYILFCAFVVIALCDPPPPPVWPNAFSVESKETQYYIDNNNKSIPMGENRAYWYYDYTNYRMRFDHYEGQSDYFCWINVDEPVNCSLLFDPSGVMFVNYPSKNYCCQLCSIGEFCTVLKPNWLQYATYNGTKQFDDNRTCDVWNEQGATAMDFWAQDANVPCAYFEYVHGNHTDTNYFHELAFDADTYVVGEPNGSIFNVPNQCHQICPKVPNFTSSYVEHFVSILEHKNNA